MRIGTKKREIIFIPEDEIDAFNLGKISQKLHDVEYEFIIKSGEPDGRVEYIKFSITELMAFLIEAEIIKN